MIISLSRALGRLYAWTFPATAVAVLRQHQLSGRKLLTWFWQSRSFTTSAKPEPADLPLVWLVGAAALSQAVCGIWLLVDWARSGMAGEWAFGAALLLAYPIVSVHVLALGAGLGKLGHYVLHPKKAGRALVCSVLESQVRTLRRRHPHLKVVAVAGSVGKTSTKLAIAELLAQTKRVQYQAGNYNDRVTVPLIFFGEDNPSLLNIIAWLQIFRKNSAALRAPYPYDVVVVELGTDGPGYMKDFAYVRPDITVLTAITPEHMEYFKTLDAVAAEELTVFDYSKQVLVNGDDTPGTYLTGHKFSDYSITSSQAVYFAKPKLDGLNGQSLRLHIRGTDIVSSSQFVGAHGANFMLAAAAVADLLGVSSEQIATGLPQLRPFPGRMQILAGSNNVKLIDDTYNASPIAARAALDVLYGLKVPQRIAILGSMNELGEYSQEAHTEVGMYCDPKKLDLVVTIGNDAALYLAPAAESQGCTVRSFTSPYKAGKYVKKALKSGAAVLAKGSQNGVFAEEALKPLLADPSDASKLVRQSSYWVAQKRQQFTDAPS